MRNTTENQKAELLLDDNKNPSHILKALLSNMTWISTDIKGIQRNVENVTSHYQCS